MTRELLRRRAHRVPATCLALATTVALMAGCSTSPSAVSSAASPGAPTPPAFDPSGLAKLDDASRALLALLEPGEWARAYVDPLDLPRAVIVARAAGFTVPDPLGPADALNVIGPAEAIVRLAADPSVRLVTLDEDNRASRTVAAPLRADAVLPIPGAPYRTQPLPLAPSADLGAGRSAPLLAGLGRSIVTIDGRPFQRMETTLGCEPHEPRPVVCRLVVTGWRTAANGFATTDEWSATEAEARGVAPTVEAQTLAAIPRWLAREAERVARSDPTAAARIARYTLINAFTWAPGPPLEIAVYYIRPCAMTGRANGPLTASVGIISLDLADTGTCYDWLSVRVDMTTRQVLAIDEHAGP